MKLEIKWVKWFITSNSDVRAVVSSGGAGISRGEIKRVFSMPLFEQLVS
jgi:hypothetical protein